MMSSPIFGVKEFLKRETLQQCLAKDINLGSFLGGNSSNFIFYFSIYSLILLNFVLLKF